MTWGFPCQDVSIVGRQKGLIDKTGNKTRSGLYYDGLRILQYKKPKYSMIENVKNLTGKKFKDTFKQILDDLNEAGYNNYWKVLNAKDYGIPQNRERVFIISIRKDIKQNFNFPEPFDNGLRLKDLLKDNVNEKYYLSQNKVDKLLQQLREKNRNLITGTYNQKNGFIEKNVACTIDASYYKGLGCNQNRNAILEKSILIDKGNIKIKQDDICNCIDAHYGKGLDNHGARTGIIVFDPYNIALPKDQERITTLRTNHNNGNAQIIQIDLLDIKDNEQIRRVYDSNGLSLTLTTMQGGNTQPKIIVNNNLYLYNYRIRRLTPLECFRLMGFDDSDYYILKQNKISDSQIYKMAGNSIVVNVLENIFRKLFLLN